jgi:solute carrier family 50 protein (sugar transporter)
MTYKTIILEFICPCLGTIIGNLIFFAPLKDMKKALRDGSLGDLNPTPWAFMLGNSLGHVTYGIFLQNLWVFFADFFGLIISIWFNLGAVKLLYQDHRAEVVKQNVVTLMKSEDTNFSSRTRITLPVIDDGEESIESGFDPMNSSFDAYNDDSRSAADWAKLILDITAHKRPIPTSHENLVIIIILIWAVCISVVSLVPSIPQSTRELIIGCLVNVNLVFFYGAPLSTVIQVIKEKDSSSIHIPTMMANTLNGAFWSAYGFAIFNLFIAVPNGLGVVLGLIQVSLCWIYPRRGGPKCFLEADITFPVQSYHHEKDIETD